MCSRSYRRLAHSLSLSFSLTPSFDHHHHHHHHHHHLFSLSWRRLGPFNSPFQVVLSLAADSASLHLQIPSCVLSLSTILRSTIVLFLEKMKVNGFRYSVKRQIRDNACVIMVKPFKGSCSSSQKI